MIAGASFAHRPVIIGAGLAGLTTALSLAPMPVIVLCAGKLGEQSSSGWAQGGIAAAVDAADAPLLHAEDTIKAGAGLCDRAIVNLVTQGGGAVIEKLAGYGVRFDRNAEGRLQLGLEGAHSRRRIVHVGGDGAGRAIMQAIIARVQATPSIDVIEEARAIDLVAGDSGIEAVIFIGSGTRTILPANHVVLATGGAGALWKHTTNPLGSWGCGLALAARVGAQLADLEFMQFHPTAIDIGRDPMPLASEALRGEGAVLIDEDGARFMAAFPRAELEPRDIVARAIHAHMHKNHRVFLDARAALGDRFAKRFPAIDATCLAAGLDPARDPIPVRPAAHYHMGGIAVDAWGRSSVEGLWAGGEVAATGLHGANRLASNSLLEAAFFGARIAESIADASAKARPLSVPGAARTEAREIVTDDVSEDVRRIMSTHLGVLRDGAGLEDAGERLAPLARFSDMALVGLMIATTALGREESRGSHTRLDHPALAAHGARRRITTLKDVMRGAPSAAAPASFRAAGA